MPSKAVALRVGVTGGIGSGKSTVCSIFEEIGRPVLRADAISKEIADQDPEILEQILRLLGTKAYGPGGKLDRRYVASRVFPDPRLRQRLEGILHPAVIREINRRILALPESLALPYVIIEAALIYEARLERELDYVIVVDADEEERIRRVMAREDVGREEVNARIASQLPAAVKVRRADFVLYNNSNPSHLRGRVLFLHRLLSCLPTRA